MTGPVMIDVAGTELCADDIGRLRHPATGGAILFARNHESVDQLYRLVAQIHELRSPPLLIAVDQEGGRVQRFREGFTRLPPPAAILPFCDGDLSRARRVARELGWLMAAELRAAGVDFSFAPVLDLGLGISEVIGDRAFGETPEAVAALGEAWMLGAREAGMISVGKHFPGHGAVRADSHHELPVDERPAAHVLDGVAPFRTLIAAGLEAIMPAHVVYAQCDADPAGFSRHWLRTVLRGELRFEGVIFSDDLSMKAAEATGGPAERARAAIDAGCDQVLVCNDPQAAEAVLDALAGHHDAKAMSRLLRLYGRPAPDRRTLHGLSRWKDAVRLAGEVTRRHESGVTR